MFNPTCASNIYIHDLKLATCFVAGAGLAWPSILVYCLFVKVVCRCWCYQSVTLSPVRLELRLYAVPFHCNKRSSHLDLTILNLLLLCSYHSCHSFVNMLETKILWNSAINCLLSRIGKINPSLKILLWSEFGHSCHLIWFAEPNLSKWI